MAILTAFDDRIVLHRTDISPDGRRSGSGLHAASPILMGLAAPLIAVVLIDPSAMGHTRFVMMTLLFALMFIAGGIFLFAAINPGQVVAVAVAPKERSVTIVRQGLFGGQETVIPFNEISSWSVVNTYDRDGYGTAEPLLLLRDGVAVPLPEGTDEAQVNTLRRTLGRD